MVTKLLAKVGILQRQDHGYVEPLSLPWPTAQPAEPIIIPGCSATPYPNPFDQLATYLEIGARLHDLCRNTFVEKVQVGYYAYERREEWRTCALAAAYAGAFGPQSIEQPEFSYSMAIWRLSERIGLDLAHFVVEGPTGRFQIIPDEMIALVDQNYWTRPGVAHWIRTLRRKY